jgi:uncharacterized membrane protein YecN with MAPEG domain
MESPFYPPSSPPSSSFPSLHSSPSLHLPQAEPLCTPLRLAGPCRRAAQVQESVDRESDEYQRSNGAHGEMQRRTRPLALSPSRSLRVCVRACGGGREEEDEENGIPGRGCPPWARQTSPATKQFSKLSALAHLLRKITCRRNVSEYVPAYIVLIDLMMAKCIR